MTDAVRRALRTFVQAFVGVLVGSGILSATVDSGVVNGDAYKKVAVSAIAAGCIAVVSLVQNWAEDNTRLPALLKAPPSSGENPVPAARPARKAPAKKRPAKKAAPKKGLP